MRSNSGSNLQASTSPSTGEAVRCTCNKLICIRHGNVIQIKCNKCKRMVSIHTLGIERIEIQ